MLDVHRNKKGLDFLANENNIKTAKLLQKRWNELTAIIQILQIPYKATIAIQKPDLTLPDAYGIWLKMMILLRSPGISRLKGTNMADCLIVSLDQRKENIMDSTMMQCALYLDPRYRIEVLRNREIAEKAAQTLSELWTRIDTIRRPNTPLNRSASDCDLNLSIDFNISEQLDEYLARGTHVTAPTANDIEDEIELFQPDKLPTNESVIDFWERNKEEFPRLYELAVILYAIPPTEVQIERDFSDLEFIFSPRRYHLAPDLLDAVLVIHLNKDLFQEIKKDELANVLNEDSLLKTVEIL